MTMGVLTMNIRIDAADMRLLRGTVSAMAHAECRLNFGVGGNIGKYRTMSTMSSSSIALWVYVTVCHDPHKIDWAFRLNGRPENDAVTIFKIAEGKWSIKFTVPPSANYQLNFESKKTDPIGYYSWEEYENEPVF